MSVFGIGVDVVENERIGALLERHGGSFVAKVFTEGERRYCEMQRDPVPHYAARFAAKEAIAKALGCGIGKDLNWTDMDIQRSESGAPHVRLYGAGARFMQEQGIGEVMISLSHARQYSAANAIALRG